MGRHGIDQAGKSQSLTCALHLHSVIGMERMIRIAVLASCLFSTWAHAIQVPGLYEAEVPVADQQEENRRQALKTALQIVLVKLTGDRFAPGRTAVAPLLQAPESYLQQYRYNETASGDSQDVPRLFLWTRFDEAILNKKLRALGLPVWGRERPSTLIWLAVEDENGRRLTSLENDPDIVTVVDKRARLRGVTLLFPLVDLEDSARLRASDLWGGFRQPVLEASDRYRADAILTGTVYSPVPGIWEGRWVAYMDNKETSWTTEGDLRDVVLDEGIDGMADFLAGEFIRIDTGQGSVRIVVADIFNTDQYAKTLKYLGSLNAITNVDVSEVQQGRVTFIVTAHGGQPAVTQAIALGRVLEPIGPQQGEYRLLP